jgi:hypothetical protein
MLRWIEVEDKTLFGLKVKMYREPFLPKNITRSVYENLEFDHQAYKYLGSELLMYRILDTNFVRYMEERGDVSRISDVIIPTSADKVNTVL